MKAFASLGVLLVSTFAQAQSIRHQEVPYEPDTEFKAQQVDCAGGLLLMTAGYDKQFGASMLLEYSNENGVLLTISKNEAMPSAELNLYSLTGIYHVKKLWGEDDSVGFDYETASRIVNSHDKIYSQEPVGYTSGDRWVDLKPGGYGFPVNPEGFDPEKSKFHLGSHTLFHAKPGLNQAAVDLLKSETIRLIESIPATQQANLDQLVKEGVESNQIAAWKSVELSLFKAVSKTCSILEDTEINAALQAASAKSSEILKVE